MSIHTDHHPDCPQHIDHALQCKCDDLEHEHNHTGGQGYPPPAPAPAPDTRLVFRPTTTASKLGPVVVGSVRAELLEESCTGCAHFIKDRKGGRSCYAWRGYSLMAYRAMAKAINRRKAAAKTDKTPPAYTLRGAIAARQWDARYVRLTMIGDASVCTDHELADVRQHAAENNLGVLGYTAHWATRGDRPIMRNMFLASTQTDGATRQAVSRGWVVAQTVDAQRFADAMPAGHITTASGQRLRLCDHQAAVLDVKHPPSCNECGLCSVPNMTASGYDGVALAAHGPSTHGKAWTRLVKAARAAVDAVRGVA
jgi:hypothetical protein